MKYIPYTIKLIKLRLKNPIFKKLETELKFFFQEVKIYENKKAMVLAAGFGSRLKPITSKIPKPLLEIGKKIF